MAVTTSAVLGAIGAVAGTAVAIKGQQDVKDAQQEAADAQTRAAAESASLIAKAGAAAEKDLTRAGKEGAILTAKGAFEAEREISPFTEAARGFDQAQDLILGGQPISGPIADQIRLAALSGARSPILETSGRPVQREIGRQAGLAASGATPEITQALLTQGIQGIGALGDVASIRQRGFESLADIAGGTEAAKASVLIGQNPTLQQLAAQGQEARLLSNIAGQQAQTAAGESIAQLAGRLF